MVTCVIPRIWEGGTCFVIAGGTSVPRQFDVPEEVVNDVMVGKQEPSAYSPYMESLHDKHVIGVNNAFKIGNWIDALFFGDCSWYLVYRIPLSRMAIMKVTCCNRFAKRNEKESLGIWYLERDRSKAYGIGTNPSKVCWNNNSGAAAINLAAHFGAKRIILLGFDMSLDHNQISHWHGSHHRNDHESRRRIKAKPPPFARHLKGFPFIANDAKGLGIEILNASPISVIEHFEKIHVRDVL